MKEKFYIFILFFLIVQQTINIKQCYGQWVKCNGINSVPIYSLTANESNIFAGTFSSGVYLSTNNGTSWTQTVLNNQIVFSMAASGSNIFAGTYYSLFYSTNNGYSWTRNPLNNQYVYSLAVNGNNIYAGTSGAGVFLSTNNGANWTQTSFNNLHVYSLAISGSNIFAGTYYYGIYLSTNNGVSWMQTPFNNQTVSSLTVSGSNILAGTDCNGVYLSSNNGTTWTQTTLKNAGVNSLAVCGNNIFAGTNAFGVFLSSDNGTTWIQKNQGFNVTPSVASLLITNNFIFVGTYGNSIWCRSYYDIIGAQSPEIPLTHSLSQNYPNPFNYNTNISYKVAGTSIIKLVVYDILGKEVETLVNKYQTPGTYDINWKGLGYSSRIYFYSLFADGMKIDTKRMVMIK